MVDATGRDDAVAEVDGVVPVDLVDACEQRPAGGVEPPLAALGTTASADAGAHDAGVTMR